MIISARASLISKTTSATQARDEFDKAVDEILMSGLDVRANQRLQTFYLELVERIYREEVPMIQTAPRNSKTRRRSSRRQRPMPNAETVEVAKVQQPKTSSDWFSPTGFRSFTAGSA